MVLLFDPHTFLGLHSLVKSLAPATTLEDAPRELIDDLHLTVGYHIINVAFKQLASAQRCLQLVNKVLIYVLVKIVDSKRFFYASNSLFGRNHCLLRLINLVITIAR
ncbi:unannotated protein [freshwater metagenome]|uniref:Unannotated protein n=1 Tax=freshwater metagenome TaxID=449393 RepID=A0A6J7CPU2_9ZZZZ